MNKSISTSIQILMVAIATGAVYYMTASGMDANRRAFLTLDKRFDALVDGHNQTNNKLGTYFPHLESLVLGV